MVRKERTALWERLVALLVSPRGLATLIGLLVGLGIAVHTDLFALLSALEIGDANELVRQADGIVQYAVILVLAAIPVVEILVVVPIGVGIGLNPVAVAAFAFIGNVLPIYGIILFYDRLKTWWQNRTETTTEPSKRKERARAIWNRYGLPGLALVSPVATGVHLAAALALAIGSEKRSVAVWMTGAIALWTVLLTAGVYYGVGFVTGL
ncbi:small multi-drug export protein [Natronolimnohabitans innermongolicus]|uniref:Small multi-drug export protein n=1 Tax=Natronolimnohabitans innermongolicus JCM 12255 TaxID=1227499 RepID=L9WN36_9EURY|nr:small multi-drug export protein [Natronolimnohabitans innermongolicus]ELY50890.1 hypothetical protein C493_17931 [Natronolimnohabitans innermongolicus JCM 12255]